MTIPLVDFAVQNPWLAFGLAWPTLLTIICLAWFFAEVMARVMGLITTLATLMSNTLVLCVRGYAPESAEAHPEDEEPPAS